MCDDMFDVIMFTLQAVRVLTVTHGHTLHSLVQKAQGLLTDVQTELTQTALNYIFGCN